MTTPTLPPVLVARLRPWHLLVADGFLAVAVALGCAYAATEEPHGRFGVREPLWLSLVIGALMGLPLAVRRRWPVPVGLLVLAVSMAALLSGAIPDYASASAALALGCALYVVGLDAQRRRPLLILLMFVTAIGGTLILVTDDVLSNAGGIGFACSMVGIAWLAGRIVRERRVATVRAAAQLTRQAVDEERLRIARELHDAVAHSMSLIVVKAAIANHVADRDPAQARDALRVIETTGRDALAELRRALGMLREEEVPLVPTPGIDALPGLAEQAAAVGGVDVALEVRGEAAVPEAVGRSVFRIVQESLTNVVRHAGPARCRATVVVDGGRDGGEVRIDVVDDGQGGDRPPGQGHGLIGMRERVAVHGGHFSAGPRAGGGFAVTARLPFGPAA